VTQQNAALVEEAAAAAESLQDQAANLLRVVSVFKTGDTQMLKLTPAAAPHLKRKTTLAPPTKKPLLAGSGTSGKVASRSVSSAGMSAARTVSKPISVRTVAPVATTSGGDWEEF